MNDLFQGFEFICAYIYMNFYYLTKGYWKYCVHKLQPMLNKLKETGLKFIIEKSFFEQTEMKY